MSVISPQDLEEICLSSIEKNNVEKLKQFLSTGFNVNSFLRSRNSKFWDTNCFSILAIASYSGAISIVEFLIQRSVLINQVDSLQNRTALHWAVASGNYEISKMLIDAGAFVNALDKDSLSPLIIAAHSGNLNILKLLVKHGADVNQCDRMNTSALYYACMRLNDGIARELICAGCTMNSNSPFNWCSPVKYLVFDKRYETARLLIESGCDLTGDKWICDDSFLAKNKIDKEFIEWLRNYMKNPPKLMSLCRQRIRTAIGSQFLSDKIKTLSLPKYLEEYLKMKF